MKPWMRANWSVAASCLVVAAVTCGGVFAYSQTRAPDYAATVSLLAVPEPHNATRGTDLSAQVALTLPGLSEIVRSRQVLDAVIHSNPRAPSLTELQNSISVQLVPASGFARITVIRSDSTSAAHIASAVATAVGKLDLLRPFGYFRLFDAKSPIVKKVGPTATRSAGFALASAVFAAILAAFILTTRPRRRLTSRYQIMSAARDPYLAIIDYKPSNRLDPLLDRLASWRRITIVGAGADAESFARHLQEKVDALDPPSVNASHRVAQVTILVVISGAVSVDEFSNTVSFLRSSGQSPIAVLLVRP
jgi:capsular polysaccharide biosynthesis protein